MGIYTLNSSLTSSQPTLKDIEDAKKIKNKAFSTMTFSLHMYPVPMIENYLIYNSKDEAIEADSKNCMFSQPQLNPMHANRKNHLDAIIETGYTNASVYISDDGKIKRLDDLVLALDLKKSNIPAYSSYANDLLSELAKEDLPMDHIIAQAPCHTMAYTAGMKTMFINADMYFSVKDEVKDEVNSIVWHEAAHNRYPGLVYGRIVSEAIADMYSWRHIVENNSGEHQNIVMERLSTYLGLLDIPTFQKEKKAMAELIEGAGMEDLFKILETSIRLYPNFKRIRNDPHANGGFVNTLAMQGTMTAAENLPTYKKLDKCNKKYIDGDYGESWTSFYDFLGELMEK